MTTAGGEGIFELALPKARANYRPLTPLDFLSWSASVFPERAGVLYAGTAEMQRALISQELGL